jgi:auxin efflux carrier family protein
MMQLVILIQAATPTAINMSVIAAMHNYLVKEIATLLFYQYLFTVISLTINVSVFLWVIPLLSAPAS